MLYSQLIRNKHGGKWVGMVVHVTEDLLKSNCKIYCHQVNCRGVMGSGLAKQVRAKYVEAYQSYVQFCNIYGSGLLGKTEFVVCNDGHIIANLFGQDGFGYGKQYTNYEALEMCIRTVYERVIKSGETVAFPYLMGCDRGGGDWNIVLEIIEKYFGDTDIRCEIAHL